MPQEFPPFLPVTAVRRYVHGANDRQHWPVPCLDSRCAALDVSACDNKRIAQIPPVQCVASPSFSRCFPSLADRNPRP
jgi:hypothetical protein